MVVGMSKSWRRGMVPLAAAMLGVMLMAASCSSSKSGSTSPTSTTTGALGTPNVAKGSPLKIGYITDGNHGAINNLSEIPAAQAAVKYVNKYLGGVGGHVLSLDVCDDEQTPAGGTDCANQLIAAKVPVVLMNAVSETTMYPLLEGAGVPIVNYSAASQQQITGKLSYILPNDIGATFAGPAKIAQNAGAKRAAVFIIDVPTATGPAQQLDPLIYKNAGVPVDIVSIPPGTADMTPQMQAEIGKGVDSIQVFGNSSFCTSLLKAAKTLGYKGTTVLIQQCIANGSSAGIPGGYAGNKVVAVATTVPTDPDVKIYKAAMSTYAPGTPPFANGVTPGGFATVVSFAKAMKHLTGTTTSNDIVKTLNAMPPTPLFFGAGITFQCNRKQIVIAPAICSTGVLEQTLDQAGNVTGATKLLDTSDLLKLKP